jgi:hypothetical protein
MNLIRHSTDFQKFNIRFVMAVRAPVCPDRITLLPLDRFKTKLIFVNFCKNCGENSSLVKKFWRKFKFV